VETLFLVLRVAVSLGVVLAVIWFAHRRISANRARTRTQQLVTVVARQSLAPKASMVVVDADGRRLMLGVTEHGVTVLSDRAAPALPALDESAEAAAFAELVEANRPAFDLASASSASSASSAGSADGHTPDHSPTLTPATHGMRRGTILSAETWKRSLAGVKEGLGI
jgi:flagellar biogenesis protein FliO